MRLPGVEGSQPLLWIGLDDGALFAQPADQTVGQISCNGTPLTTSRWLHDGDLLSVGRAQITVTIDGEHFRLTVVDPAEDNITEPPNVPLATLQSTVTPTMVTPIEFSPKTADERQLKAWRFRPGLVLEAALLAALGVAVWFVFTARSISIDIDPTPERISVRGGFPSIHLAERFVLRPGSYEVIAERAGYRTLNAPIEVTKEAGQRFSFRLEQLPGVLAVFTGPVLGASVFVDGEPVGATPLTNVELPVGRHEVTIRSERYQDFVATINLDRPGSEHTLEVELTPAWADVTLRTEPAGATIRIGDASFGQTPATVEVIAGKHTVEFILDGYKPHRKRLEIVANQPQNLPTVTLVPADGNVSIVSHPSEALVTVNGTYRGSTPVVLQLSAEKSHDITVSKSGFETATRIVEILPEQTRKLEIDLVQLYGEVTIASKPPNAEVLVNGEARGASGQILRLPAVEHDIEVRKPGYEPFRTTIVPRPGLPASLEVTLQAVGGAIANPPVIFTPQKVEMRLIPPGRFTMGASRREPGRRANETLREVEVTRPFYLAIREVSNREFREFASQHRSGSAGRYSLETDHHPVVRVTWEEAARYCNWLSEKEGLPPVYVERSGSLVARSPLPDGYRLPTEAEWAWAVRVPSGTSELKYAWGNNLPIPEGTDNYGDSSASDLLGRSLPEYNDSEPVTAPVGSYAPNPRGLFNMGGNVSEWVHDVYTIYPPSEGKLERDPTGPPDGEYHVIRGASWMDESVSELRLSYRDYGDDPRPDVGFRVARSAR